MIYILYILYIIYRIRANHKKLKNTLEIDSTSYS